jgi:hypothetical protein
VALKTDEQRKAFFAKLKRRLRRLHKQKRKSEQMRAEERMLKRLVKLESRKLTPKQFAELQSRARVQPRSRVEMRVGHPKKASIRRSRRG